MISFHVKKKGLAGRVDIHTPTWPEIMAAVVLAATTLGVVWLLAR